MILYTLLGILAVLIFWARKRNVILSDFPRKKGLLFFGNTFQVDLERPDITFSEWTKELGGAFAVDFPHQTKLILNSYDSIYEALVVRGKEFSGRPNDYFRIGMWTLGYKDVVFLPPNDKWRMIRKTCMKKIKMHDKAGLKRIEDLNMNAIRELLVNFTLHDGAFDPTDNIWHALIDIITSLLLEKVYDSDTVQVISDLEQKARCCLMPVGKGFELDIFPWLRYFGNDTFKRLDQCSQVQTYLWSLIYPSLVKENKDGILHSLAAMDEDCKLDEVTLKSNYFMLLAAGISTTGNSIRMYLNYLAHHPKLAAEIRRNVDHVVGLDRQVCLADRADLPFVMACVYELTRFTTVVPLGVPHTAVTDTHIDGKFVPAGTEILMNLWHLHHDENFWESPYEFRPERFLEKDGLLVSASHPNRKHLLPFGAGPRVCLGELLALSRLFLVLASISQVLDIEPTSEHVSWDPRHYETGFVLAQSQYKIFVKKRSGTWLDNLEISPN